LNVTSEPNGAEIFVGGAPRGKTPLRIEVPARPHELIARFGGWPDERQTIDARPNQENSAQFVFANGSIKITSAPGGASVLSNGRELGRTPLVIEEVKPGKVNYELHLAGYKPAVVRGEVAPQQQAFLAARLEKERDENILDPSLVYRLPTDLEWSAAVGLPKESGATPEMRDGKIRNEFPWGKQWPPPNGAGNYADQSARRLGASVIENYSDNF